jgi:hypothetical protein
MAPTTPGACDDWDPVAFVFALPELWGIVAEHRGGEGVAAKPSGAGGVRRVYSDE